MTEAQAANDDQLRWLLWAVENAPTWATEDRALLTALELLLTRDDAQAVVKELERRLEAWPTKRHEQTAVALRELHLKDNLSAQEFQRIDRAMLRLIPELRGATARELARTCLGSTRPLRRRAAWRYFTRQGSRSETLRTLKRVMAEKDKAFLEWLVVEPRLVLSVDLDLLLPQIASFYWRARVLETAIRVNRDAVVAVADAYPVETLAAIRWACQEKDIALAREIEGRHPADVSVVTEAIRAFATLHAVSDLERTLAVGRDILRRDPLYEQLIDGGVKARRSVGPSP